MAKMVGFTRILRLPWLDKAMELAARGLTLEQMKEELEDYLSFEIDSDTNRRKTREILITMWGRDNGVTERLRADGLELAASHPDKRIAVHWGMLMAAFPVFVDIVRLIGRMCDYQEEFTTAQVKQKVFDEWGERTTIVKGSEKIVASLNQFGVIERVTRGRYRVANPIALDEDLTNYLIFADMLVNQTSYRSFSELQNVSELFPFVCNVSKERLVEDKRFETSTFGGEFSVGIRK